MLSVMEIAQENSEGFAFDFVLDNFDLCAHILGKYSNGLYDYLNLDDSLVFLND